MGSNRTIQCNVRIVAATHRDLENAIGALSGNAWRGNVRELANLLERLAILYPNQTVGVAELPERYRAGVAPEALEQAGGTVAEAARLLRMRRTTLVEKLRKYRLNA